MAGPGDDPDPFARFTAPAPGSGVPPQGAAPAPAADPDPFAKYARAGSSGADPGILESIGRGAVEGATFGLDPLLGMSRERREAAQRAHPWASFAGELLGGAAPMAAAYLLPTGAGQAAAGVRTASLLRRLGTLVRAGMTPGEMETMGQTLVQGAKLGSVYGGESGTGHAIGNLTGNETLPEAVGNVALGGLKGAVVGAATGPLFGLGARGIYRGAQEIGTHLDRAAAETAPGGRGALVKATKGLEWDRLSPQNIIDQIYGEFPDPSNINPQTGAVVGRRYYGPSNNRQPWTAPEIEHVVSRSMAGESPSTIASNMPANANGITPTADAVQTIVDELAQRYLGPRNIVDRAGAIRPGSGENTLMGLRVAATSRGEATGKAREALLERQVASSDRIHELMDRFVGSPDYEGTAARHTANLTAAGNRLYGLAAQNERPFDLSDIISSWMGRTDLPDAARAAIARFAPETPNWQQSLAGALRLPGMPATQVAPTAAENAAVTTAATRLATAQKAAESAREAVSHWSYLTREGSQFAGTEMPPALRNAVETTQNEVNTAHAALQEAQEAANVPVSPLTPGGPFQRNGPIGLDAFQARRAQIRDAINNSWKETPDGWQMDSTGRALSGFYRDITNRVRQTNPDWAVANDAWRDGEAASNAMMAGARMTTRLNAASRENLSEFTDAQRLATAAQTELRQAQRAITGSRRQPTAQDIANATPEQRAALTQAQARLDAGNSRMELFRVGFARSISDVLVNKGDTHDLVSGMLRGGAQQILRRILGNDAQPFINGLRAEQSILRTYKAQFGSQTVPLGQAIKEDQNAPRFETSMTNPLTWINPALRLAQDYMAERVRAQRNSELMDLYTETNPVRQLEYLRQMQALHQTRSNWGNRLGMPAQGVLSGLVPEAIAGRGQSQP